MDKLKMAHEYALENMFKDEYSKMTAGEFAKKSFEYADAMQAEEDEREKEIKHNHLKTCADAYMNCEIQVTDPDGNCRITTRQKELDRKEWQPDWSQAPEWAVAWTYDKNAALWWSEVPEIHKNIWDGRVQECVNAPSFNYQGNWQDSLRKRPSNI